VTCLQHPLDNIAANKAASAGDEDTPIASQSFSAFSSSDMMSQTSAI
jgi:hypothetical protein